MEHTLLEKIKIRLQQFHMESRVDDNGNVEAEIVFDDVDQNPIIEQLIDEAWKDVKSYRQYPPTYTDEYIAEDLLRYENVVIKLVVYDFNKIGAEFETDNKEDSNSRSYVKRESILSEIFPFVTVLF